MKSVIIFLALVAFCQAAPLDVKETSSEVSSRPSPISPDVIVDPKPTAKVVLLKDAPVLDRQTRSEPKKPEQLHHNDHGLKPTPADLHHQKPSPAAGPHDAHDRKHKREAHHEEGHNEPPRKEEVKDAPEAPEPKKEKRDTEPAPKPEGEKPKESQEAGELIKPLIGVVDKKKERREAHHEEGHKQEDKPQVEDLSTLPHALPADAHTAELPKKEEKREAPVEKPDSVKARESIQHNPHHSEELHKTLETLAGSKTTEQRHQRDIPVPTQTKPTESAAKPEIGSTTPSVHHLNIPHPIPVSELFEKNKQKDKSSSSSEESKEKVKA